MSCNQWSRKNSLYLVYFSLHMFWYISFLRPPLAQSLLLSPLTITPQIANDLRTNLFDDEQDLYYSWSPTIPAGKPLLPVKLTTWRQSNAYKELLVSPPPGVREGQSYRLILTANPNAGPYINLAEGSEGLGKTHPFPVISMPVVFTKNAIKSKGKQERIERIYRIPLPIASEPQIVSMKITEQTSFDLDKVCTLPFVILRLQLIYPHDRKYGTRGLDLDRG
jgi:protein N-lysine methyltransferase METTL21D